MSRTRTIYNNEVLLVGPSPATGTHSTGNIKKLHRVQSIGNSDEIPLQNVNEYGSMAAIDKINIEGPTASLEFSYFLTDFENELALGFDINSTASAIGSIAARTSDDRNYFRYVAPEGYDAVGLGPTDGAVFGVGNGFIASYSVEAAVGSFPTVSVSVQGLNSASYVNGSAKALPAVDPETGRKASGTYTLPNIVASNAAKPSVIKPGDVKVTFSNPNAGLYQALDTTLNIQNINVGFDLNLEAQRRLGSRLAFSRDIQYPIDVNLSVEALMGDLTASTGLVDFLCNEPETDITIDFYKSSCDASGPTTAAADLFAKIIVKNARLTSQNLNGSIGPSHTASMQFSAQVGAANDSVNGIFFSGVTGYSGSTPLKSS